MRGFFAIGVEGISKPMNVGNLFRSARAFGASFTFTIDAAETAVNVPSDTGRSAEHTPFYSWRGVEEIRLPKGCRLVGVELTDDAIELPSFRHPLQCAYVLGPERSSLSPGLMDACDFVVKIPTRYCINVAVAGAIVMYDRMISLGRFAPRPVGAGGGEDLDPHTFGGIFSRRRSPDG